MKTKTHIKQYLLIALLGLFTVSCWDNVPTEEDLPSPDVAFIYRVIDVDEEGNPSYQFDYYTGATVEFTSISALKGECVWEFGDGKGDVGNVVKHQFEDGGTYSVKLTVNGAKSKTQPILIKDIVPILTLDPIEDEDGEDEGICIVRKTPVTISVELPNPKKSEPEYEWELPVGTIVDGIVTETLPNGKLRYKGENPGKLKFNHVGSQAVVLRVKLDKTPLKEEGKTNVHVAYNQEVPTLYFAVKNRNIMARKLIPTPPAGMIIYPYDLAVSAGKRALNILFNDQSLYMLDCGKQFHYVDDADGVLGDGRITIVTMSPSKVEKVETMITNVGGAAFNDPYYGYIEGSNLYYGNRNTGIVKLSLTDRNKVYSAASFPWYVQNATLGYYGNGWSYGSMNACFTKIDETWYWCKTYNGTGIYRFTEADILPATITGGKDKPAAGIALGGMLPKSLVWDSQMKVIYFTIFDEGYAGLYGCTLEAFNAIGETKSNLAKYKLTTNMGTTTGKSVVPITEQGKDEGAPGEYIGICQLALDEATGCVYFGYRSPNETELKSGLMRFRPISDTPRADGSVNGVIEHVIEGIQVYGVAVNKAKSKLF